VSPATEVINMRAPATAPIPLHDVIMAKTEPSWDELMRSRRRHPRLKTPRAVLVAFWVEKVALAVGWGGVLGLVLEITYSGPVV
jgi:hypothetical protein